MYSNLSLPNEFTPSAANFNHIKRKDADSPVNQPSLKLFDVAVKASQANSMNFHSSAFNLNGNSLSNSPNINDIDDKFKMKRGLDDDLDDENSNSNPVNLDIYRKRQFQKRVR